MIKSLIVFIISIALTFAIQAQPVLTKLADFNGTNGSMPSASLTLGNDGNFYGTTFSGGISNVSFTNGMGTVFKLTSDGKVTCLAKFNGDETDGLGNSINEFGAYPSGLILGIDGNFYGTALAGGADGYGTVFRVTTNGSLTTVSAFTWDTGAIPMAGLTLASDGSFYGTTVSGTTNWNGTVFQVTTDDVLTVIAPFAAAFSNVGNQLINDNGVLCTGNLVPGNDGCLYGTAVNGGLGGNGTVFQVTPDGLIAALLQFAPGKTNGNGDAVNSDGAHPEGGLIFGADDNLYGTTLMGGSNGVGSVFSVTTNGDFRTLAFFDGNDGAYPSGNLLEGSDGSFYGTTQYGGEYNDGTIFRITPDGQMMTIWAFSGDDGSVPLAGLTLGLDGNFYGSTCFGGSSGNGTLFKLVLPPAIGFLSLSNGVAQISLTGLARPTVEIQCTTNLSGNWMTLTNLIFTNGSCQFTDFDAAISQMKFYRALVR